MKNILFLLSFILVILQAKAQQWSYQHLNLQAKYIAEVYELKIEADTIDSTLIEVLGFDNQLRTIEEVDASGWKQKKTYNTEGNLVEELDYYNTSNGISIIKNVYTYKNGLEISNISFEFINEQWQKKTTRFSKYIFNKKGQVVSKTYLNENDQIFYKAYMTYDTHLKTQPLYYYDDLGNLKLPSCTAVKVVIENSISHYNLYKYDKNGNEINYIFTHKDKSPSYIYEYQYDNSNRLIAYNYYNGNNFSKRVVYKRLSNGLISKQMTYEDKEQSKLIEELVYHYQ